MRADGDREPVATGAVHAGGLRSAVLAGQPAA